MDVLSSPPLGTASVVLPTTAKGHSIKVCTSYYRFSGFVIYLVQIGINLESLILVVVIKVKPINY